MNKLCAYCVHVVCMIGVLCVTENCAIPKNTETLSIFNSLDEVKQYAQSLPEYPLADNDDILNPLFQTFYKSRQPSFWHTLTSFLWSHNNTWYPGAFDRLLRDVIAGRHAAGYAGRLVSVLVPKSSDKYIFITELQGCFHAFVDYLQSLRDDGIIDGHFNIIKPEYYMVFSGNIITGFAYGLDTLTLVLRLLYNNPGHILCVRGSREDQVLWEHDSFSQELKIRLASYDYETIKGLINDLIDTFPLAYYMKRKQAKKEDTLVRICSNKAWVQEFEKQGGAAILRGPGMIPVDTQAQVGNSISVNAFITGEQRMSEMYIHTLGLRKIVSEDNSITWIMLSGATPFWRIVHQFFYESYVLLTTGEKQWTLTLYNQDIRMRTGIVPCKMYDLFTGQEMVSPEMKSIGAVRIEKQKKQVEDALKSALHDVKNAEQVVAQTGKRQVVSAGDQQDIVLGSTMDLSKSDKVMGTIIKNVLESFFAMVNREKILGSRAVKMYVLDDEYNVAKARSNVSRLIQEHDVQALIMPVGSANLQGYLDMVNNGQIAVLFAQADSPAFRKPDLKNIINFSASSYEVGYITLAFAQTKSAIRKLVLFYEAITGGILDGAKRAAAEYNIQALKDVAFTALDVDYSEQVKTIKNEGPDAIMFFSGITPALSLVRSLGIDYLIDKPLIGGSVFLNVDSFKKNIHEKGLNMIIPSLVPNPKKADLPIVKDFRAFALSNNIPEEPVALQTYISARIFVEIAKRIEGPVTKQKIVEVAEQFKHVDLGGIDLAFDPQTRRLINTIWIDDGSEQWHMKSIEGIAK